MCRSRILLILAALALTACSAEPLPPAIDPPPVAGLTCGGGPSFPADILDGAGGAENGPGPAAAALRHHLAMNSQNVAFLPDAGWIEVSRTDALALYLAPDPTSDGSWVHVSIGHSGAGWEVDSWGSCNLQPSLEAGLGIASFRVAPDIELDPTAIEIAVLVTERACNSGEDARGRIVVAAIDQDNDSVTVTLAARSRGGNHTCPSNPETRFVLELPEPLGERALLDGSSVPPRDATLCPDIAMCP